jgi:hypothetical protein
VDLYIHSPIRPHGVVLNYLSTGTTLPLPYITFHCQNNQFEASGRTIDASYKYFDLPSEKVLELVRFFRIPKLIFLFNGLEPRRSNSQVFFFQFDLFHYSKISLDLAISLCGILRSVTLSLACILTSRRI